MLVVNSRLAAPNGKRPAEIAPPCEHRSGVGEGQANNLLRQNAYLNRRDPRIS